MNRPRSLRIMGSRRHAIGGAAGLAALAAAALAGGALPALAAGTSGAARAVGDAASSPEADSSSSGWRILATAHVGPPGNASGYSAVLAPGRNNAWVFGGTNPGAGGSPLAAHWDGSSWRPSALPAGLGGFIVAASASAPGNVWAVPYQGGYALRWNGRRWSVARRWNPAARITDVAAISRTDVWVFGATVGGQRGVGTWHYNGRAWKQLAGLDSAITRASALCRGDIWAITAAPRGGMVVHYNGRSWRRVRTGTALAGAQLADVLAASPRSVWVLGLTAAGGADPGGGRVVIAHWNGRRWTRFAAPRHDLAGNPLPGMLAPDGQDGVWVTAMTAAMPTRAVLLHLSRSGAWAQASLSYGRGNSISDLALIPGTRSLWGSGGFLTHAGGDAAIWAYGQLRYLRAAAWEPAITGSGGVIWARGPIA
jgi:hypothetical protein